MKKQKLQPIDYYRISELQKRRVALWKHAHTLPDDDPKKAKIIEAAKKIYDGLVKIGFAP
jgi:hypothetical protein